MQISSFFYVAQSYEGRIGKGDYRYMKISWAAFHASQQESHRQSPVDISSLPPLFKEEAKSAAMIHHSLDVMQSAVAHLNPGQIPVVAFDQHSTQLQNRSNRNGLILTERNTMLLCVAVFMWK